MKEKLYDIYRYNGEGENSDRFVLGRSGDKPLLALCLNPSTATDEDPDATMRRLKGLAELNGFNGFVMINLYPQRSRSPYNLEREINPERHKNNLAEIARIAEELKFDTVLAAWGNNIKNRAYLRHKCLKEIAATLSEHSIKWKCISLTALRHPKHPSRAAYGTLKDFDIDEYFNRCGLTRNSD